MRNFFSHLMALLCALLLPCTSAGAEGLRFGICAYSGEDTFITSVVDTVRGLVPEGAMLTALDSRNDQNTQNAQVLSLLESGVDALIINAVDRTTAVYLIRMAAGAGVPIVFVNREPLKEDMALYSRAYYVGTDPQETGYLSGQVAADYFTAHPSADRNGDGKLQYVMLRGEPGHQDTELRSTYALRALRDAGFLPEKLGEESANWERTLAQEKMAELLAEFGERIECVLSNNDDMALGAIDAMKAAGMSGRIPVVGVDATAAAREALAAGDLTGTVLNDAENIGRACWELAWLLAQGGNVTADNYAYEMDELRRVFIPSQIITKKTLNQ